MKKAALIASALVILVFIAGYIVHLSATGESPSKSMDGKNTAVSTKQDETKPGNDATVNPSATADKLSKNTEGKNTDTSTKQDGAKPQNAADANPPSAADKLSGNPHGKEAAAPAKPNEAMPQNAATVNGKPIPMSDFLARVDQLSRQAHMSGHQHDEKEMPAMKKQILDDMINSELLKQEVEKRGIKADEAEVNAHMDSIKKSASPEDFANSLKQMNTTEQALRDYFASRLAMKKMVDGDLGSKIVVTAEEVKAFYDGNPDLFKVPEQVRASHILVKVDPKASAEEKAKALEKMKAIQKRIKDGEDFAKVAKEVSDCPSKENGGDLNFFSKGQMVPQFENAAFSTKVGSTSDIVETEFGYHIIKITDKKEPGVMAFDEIKPRIEQHLKSEKMSQEMPKYIEAISSRSKIEVFVQQ